jgi:hypothetical protein
MPRSPKFAFSVSPCRCASATPRFALSGPLTDTIVILVSLGSTVIVWEISPHGNVWVTPVHVPAKRLRARGVAVLAEDVNLGSLLGVDRIEARPATFGAGLADCFDERLTPGAGDCSGRGAAVSTGTSWIGAGRGGAPISRMRRMNTIPRRLLMVSSRMSRFLRPENVW